MGGGGGWGGGESWYFELRSTVLCLLEWPRVVTGIAKKGCVALLAG